MSTALTAISKILQAKAYETDPMSRGLTIKDMAAALDMPQQTISYCLINELEASRFGIYKMTPNRKRNILWGYSLDVANKANGLPFDTSKSAGIAPEIQAAEVNKLVEACVEPKAHKDLEIIRNVADSIKVKYGLSVARGDIIGMAFSLVDDYYKEQSNVEESEE